MIMSAENNMTQDEILEKVREAFVEALGVDDDEVLPESKIFDDLGAESLDLLEIVYLLEHEFDIKIPRDGIAEQSKADIDATDYEVDGVLTELALDKLRELMPEVPPEELTPGLLSADIPKLFRVQTFVNIVSRLLTEKTA